MKPGGARLLSLQLDSNAPKTKEPRQAAEAIRGRNPAAPRAPTVAVL